MSTEPIPYTRTPLSLLWVEVKLSFKLIFDVRKLGFLSIVVPLCRSRYPEDELAWTRRNIWTLLVHAVLILVQTIFLLFIVFSPFGGVPAFIHIGTLVLGVLVNKWFCNIALNNFGQRLYYAGMEFSQDSTDIEKQLIPRTPALVGERWVYINGVAAGSHWTTNNLQTISRIFQRPVCGVHNKSYGVLFDLLECVIQRTFSYPTEDIRNAYAVLSDLLKQREVERVVLIAHSQGGIEASLVLDWLLVTLPNEHVAKLEVYTFGCAANHFNSPETSSGVGRVIRHVEHYANTKEFVARFGVLFFRGTDSTGAVAAAGGNPARTTSRWLSCLRSPAPSATTTAILRNRFVGKLFMREEFGHMLSQHYLNNMFDADDNEFMSQVATPDNYASDGSDTEEAEVEDGQLLRDKSRLWKYRGGQRPVD